MSKPVGLAGLLVKSVLIPHTEQLVDFRNWHFGLGRRFRSLKVQDSW